MLEEHEALVPNISLALDCEVKASG